MQENEALCQALNGPIITGAGRFLCGESVYAKAHSFRRWESVRMPIEHDIAQDIEDRERRIELLVKRLPSRIQAAVHWLRRPQARWVRMPAGVFFILGGFLAILPVFGLWMLPLGVLLLSDDVPPLQHLTNKALAWVEAKRPHWMGLPHL